MKKIFVTLLLILIVAACSKDTYDKLDGKWQLKYIEEGGQSIPVDTVYYNFLTSLFQYQVYSPATETNRGCYGFKDMEGDSTLRLELTSYGMAPETFRETYTDWPAIQRSFVVEKISGSKLILQSDGKRYIFDRF